MKINILLFFLIFSFSTAQIKAVSHFDSQSAYIGCWTGMRGGKLKVTENKIYDLGSKESSSYKESSAAKTETAGIQTGEKYLLEAANDFPKSFLAKWISIAFNKDGTVGIATFNSHSDYLKDDFVGMGLFEKIPCKKLK